MAYAYPSQTNVYLPSYEASGKLTVDYSRKPSDFRVMSYLQLQKVSKTTGKYLVFKPDQAGRIPSTTLNEWRWPMPAGPAVREVGRVVQIPVAI